jgi:hypothetical protein
MAAAAAQEEKLSGDSLALVLRAHARLSFKNDHVLGALEAALFVLLQQSRATAECLSTSLLSIAQLHVAECLPADLDGTGASARRELIDGAARVALEHISFFGVPQLCNLLQAMTCLKVRDDRQVSALLLGIGNSLARQSSQLSASDCATAAKAFAVCRVHDEQLLATVASKLRDKELRSSLAPQQLADVLYGFAKFSSQDIASLDLLSVEVRRHLHTLDLLDELCTGLLSKSWRELPCANW